jgi:hypothetical protein
MKSLGLSWSEKNPSAEATSISSLLNAASAVGASALLRLLDDIVDDILQLEWFPLVVTQLSIRSFLAHFQNKIPLLTSTGGEFYEHISTDRSLVV